MFELAKLTDLKEKIKEKRRNRRFSGLFRQYFLMTAGIVLSSFLVLGIFLTFFIANYRINEKAALLRKNTSAVARNVQDVFNSGYVGESGRGSMIVVCNTLLQISNAVDADFFICNREGYVLYCKDVIDSEMQLHSGGCMVHDYYRIPKETMNDALLGDRSYAGTLEGNLNEFSFVISSPVYVNDTPVAVVFSTQPILNTLMTYLMGVLQMFAYAVLVTIAISTIIVYRQSFRMSRPLRQMSSAAKSYASGDFSARIELKKSIWITGSDEISDLVSAFNSMAQALETMENSRRSFVTNVSHELKTPMTTISGFIDGILDGTIEPERRNEYLGIVSDEVKRLSRLVTGMLNMSRIEAGKQDIKREQFDISEMIVTTLLGFEQLINNKKIEIRGLEDITRNNVNADKDMINQVIYNLIDNAVKFTEEGGYIEFSSTRDKSNAVISVKNSGNGISADERDKIFERFYKVDKSRSYDVKGAGMGLYITKTIVELHHGKISVDSEEGSWTSFTVSLPL